MKIFAVVGPSGSGKSTLIATAVAALPDKLAIVKSVTTRKRRGPEDDEHYRFISVREMDRLRVHGELVQHVTYAGNQYGVARPDLAELLRDHHGILALIEKSVKQYRDAGYEVVVIKIAPIGQPVDEAAVRVAERSVADRERAKLAVKADVTIPNSFIDPVGLQKATEGFIRFIRETIAPM